MKCDAQGHLQVVVDVCGGFGVLRLKVPEHPICARVLCGDAGDDDDDHHHADHCQGGGVEVGGGGNRDVSQAGYVTK